MQCNLACVVSPRGLIGTNTHWVWWRRLVTQNVSSILIQYQHQDKHRLSPRKSSALWRNAGSKCEEVWGPTHTPSAGTRCRLFHVVHVDSRGQRDLSSVPFCFSALRDSWSEQRLLALIWLPEQRRVLETLTHLCCPPSAWTSAIWWALDDQATPNFFLHNVSTLLYHLPRIYRAYRCILKILYYKSVLVIQGIYSLEIC